MANKEYQMLFRLGAKLGENFNGTFSSAQKVLQTTQKEVQSLNKLQSDVNAYQRQQESIEKTNYKLELYKRQLTNVQNQLPRLNLASSTLTAKEKELQAQLENVRNEMKKSGSSSEELAKKELDLKVQLETVQKELLSVSTNCAKFTSDEEQLKFRISDAEAAIAKKNQRLSEMQTDLTTAGVDVNNLTDESKRLETEMKALQEQEEKAAAEAANFGNSGATAFEAVGSALVSAGIAAALGKIKDAYNECIGVAMEFGGTMSTVEALSGATSREMATLSQTAKDLGANTAFTANQSAEAMTYMGMAGWNAQQMISGMDGVLNLAAAGGEDLASVSDIVTDNLTAFGLKASDTAHFADVLAAAATNSNTSVGIMGETFKSSASVAGALGYTIEDVSMAVGLMANAGVKGSVAGTALKNTFNGLLNGATLTAAAFGEVEYTAINADGTMKSFGETCDELRGYFSQMTEAERVQNAMVLAGQRGYNGLLAILNATDEDYQKLSDSINNCAGSAQRMANIKLDNLQGDVTLLNSAADGLKMTIGGMYDKELRQLAQLGTKILGGINEFCEKNPAVVKAIMAVVAEIGLVVGAYTAFNTVKKAKNALDTMSAALQAKNAAAAAANAAATGAEAAATTGAAGAQRAFNTTLLASPLFIVTAAVAALTAGMVVLREAFKVETIETQTLSTATKQQYDEVDRLNAQYDEACEKFGSASDQARALKYDLDEATAAIDSQSFSVKDLYAEIDSLHSSTTNLLDSISANTAEIDGNYESAMILSAKLRELSSSSDKSAKSQAKIAPIVEKLNEMYPELGLTVENVSDKMGELNGRIEQAAKSQSLQAKYESAKENLSELYVKQQKLQEAAEKADVALGKAAKQYSEVTGTNVFSAAGGLLTGRTKDTEKAYNEAHEKEQQIYEDLAAVNAKISEYEAVMAEYGTVVTGTSEEAVSAYDAISIAVGNVTDKAEELMQSYNDAYQAAYESISGQYALWDEAAEVSEMDVEDINDSLQSQADYWSTYNDNLDTLLAKSDRIEGLRDLLATFADGSTDSVDAIAGMAAEETSDDDLKLMVENWKKVQEAQEKAAGSLADTKVDFEERLNEIQTSVSETVEKMNLDDAAARAANSTIQAYANALLAGKGSVEEAAEIVSQAALGALSNTSAIEETVRAGVQMTSITPQNPMNILDNAVWGDIDKCAVGTNYAESGLALVGENGPELVNFRGGEQVLTAEKTNAILSRSSSGGGGNTITIAPVIQISGNADSDTMQQSIDEIIDRIKDALLEAGIDARRGAYI